MDSFSKTNTADLLSKKSLILHFTGKDFSSEEYFFTQTESDENNIVHFTGSPFKGHLLSEILASLHSEKSDNRIFALFAFSKAVDYLLAQGIFEENYSTGAGGIVIKADAKNICADILFINSELFEECARQNKKDYAEVTGKYIFSGLDGKSSLLFLRGVAAYSALTSHLPYDKDSMSLRQEDIFDENFIPLNLWNSSIEESLARSIEASLCLKQKQLLIVGRRNLSDSAQEIKREKLLAKAQSFDSEAFAKNLSDILKNQAWEDASLKEKREAFSKKREKFLKVKRFLRRNKNRILVTAAALFIGIWFVSGIVRENAKLITTRGLTSTQTSRALYTMIHHTDAPNVQEILSGKDTKDIMIKVSGYFVSAKQRLEVSPDNGSLSPASWLFYKKESKNWIFGITGLKIDGEDFTIEGKYPVRKDKPAKITEEKGRILKKGDVVTHEVTYNLVHQAQAKIYIDRMKDKVSLKWNGKQWKIIKVEGSVKIDSVKSSDFIEDYYAEAEKGVRERVEALREKYDWLPGEEDLRDAALSLKEKYNSSEAEKFLDSK